MTGSSGMGSKTEEERLLKEEEDERRSFEEERFTRLVFYINILFLKVIAKKRNL
jgi:hypothetical protein